jgi:hypothetical protein
MDPTLSAIVEATSAATLTGYLVSFFKLARPTASSGLIVAAAMLSGLISSTLVTAARGGLALDQKTIAVLVISGLAAAAVAAGLNRTDQTAEAKRIGPDVQAQREVVAELGKQSEKENK